MTTAPWSPAAPAALRESLFINTSATINGQVLDIEAGTVTFDEGWSPHVQVSGLRARFPDTDDPTVLGGMDPRAGTRLVLSAGYVYPSGRRDVHQLADLALRSRSVSRPENTVDLDAESDEALLQDNRPTTPLSYPGTSVVSAVIRDIVTDRLPDATIVITASDRATLGEPLDVPVGADAWSVLADLADRINARLYVDGDRVWRLVDREAFASTTVHALETGPLGTVERSQATLAARDWGNAVLVMYPDVGVHAYAQATSGPLSVTEVPTKVITVRRDVAPGSATARQRVAASVLRRTMSRGRGVTLVARPAYWLRPGHTVTVLLPTGTEERHLVSRVDFDLAAKTMTVTTRVPDDAFTYTTGA